jgi:predicted nucleic acid-binding protein
MTSSTDGPDEALLAQAAQRLGTTTATATIDRALALVIAGHRHREAVEAEAAGFAGAGPLAAAEPAGRAREPTGGWLLDTSARAAPQPPGVATALRALLAAGRLVTCAILDLEALTAAVPGHEELLGRRHLAYRSVPLDDVVAARALRLQAGLGARPGPAPAARELLLVGTASVHGLGVLHDDAALARLATTCGVPERSVTALRPVAAS